MNLRKAAEAALISVGLVTAVTGLFQALFWSFPSLRCIFLLSIPINMACFAFAGYRCTKTFKQDLLTAGASGAIAGFATGLITILIAMPIFLLFGVPPMLDFFNLRNSSQPDLVVEIVLQSTVFILLFVFAVLSAFVNFGVAWAGGVIGKKL